MKNTFKFTIYTQGGGLVASTNIPQSCMTWKETKQDKKTYLVPNGLDETGETLKRNCMYKAEKVLQEHSYNFEQYKLSEQNYFDKQRRMHNARFKKTTNS